MTTGLPLRDVCTFRSGGTPSKDNSEFWDGDIPWVSPKDMKTTLLESTQDFITLKGVEGSATSLVPKGSILTVVRSGILAHSVPFAVAGRSLAFNQDIKAIQVTGDQVTSEYVYWFLRSKESEILARGVKKGATVHSLQAGFLEKLVIPILPKPEQQQIVDLLARAEYIVQMRRKGEQKAKEIIPALFLDMFGDPGRNPKGWDFKTIGDVADIQSGLQVTTKRANLPLKIPYLRVANVHRTHLDLSEIKLIHATQAELNRTRLVPGDLLVIEGHGNPAEIGRVGIWPGGIDPCVHQNHLIRVRCKPTSFHPIYVWAYLNSEGGRRFLLREGKTTSGLNTINVSNVKGVNLPAPPIALQQDFARRIEGITELQASQHTARSLANQTFQSLLSRVFGQ